MKRNSLIGTGLVALLLLVSALLPGAALAGTGTGPTGGPISKPATVRIAMSTPDGVPASVTVSSKTNRHIAAKSPAGSTATVELKVPAGSYEVSPEDVTFNGRLYRGTGTCPRFIARPGELIVMKVTYTAVNTAYELHATSIDQTSIGLAWTAPAGSKFSLRRTLGSKPAATTGQGATVPTSGSTALDKGLKANSQYSYALFTMIKGVWTGPIVVKAGTAAPTGSTQAAYVAPPTTLIAKATDLITVTTTGTGVRVLLAASVTPPLLGSAMVLPQSAVLVGGFLGTVVAISEDGRTVDLTAGGLSDAFDYYALDVAEFSSDPAVAPAGATQKKSDDAADQKPSPTERSSAAAGPQSKTKALAATSPFKCESAASTELTFTPSMALGGHFNAKIDKYNFLGASLPKGASLDTALTATITGALGVKVSGTAKCALDLPSTMVTITTSPIPISFLFEPTARVSLDSAVELSNVGVTATAGVQLSGTLGLDGSSNFSGSPILKAAPLTPVITANGNIDLKVGGNIIVGPGAGTSKAGVIAGVGGELNPIDAKFRSVFTATDSRFNTCLNAEANFTRGLSLTAKAWLGSWDITKSITVPALQGSSSYPGSPWDLPNGCAGTPDDPEPGDDLLGDGVTKVSDSTGGLPTQWGHIDGFAPGKKTWVLSTGLIANAVGAPSQFASADLGQAGDADLTNLSGQVTYDSAYYEVSLIPTGSTLHVSYAFASEEYPEYVGSKFNDVMAVLVNGTNCATVPGTTTPISVNTVNAGLNASYYVDNSAGAAGYSTSMDGLTVPLTCSVPVTPGQPVTVRIAVADSSDHIFDSAVALLDKGIWTN
jgi:hypothetical protein